MLAAGAAPGEAANLDQGAFAPTAAMKRLDADYFALHFSDPLAGYVKRFVSAQPWYHVVDDADYRPVMTWLFGRR